MSHRPWNELSARRPARERGGRIALLLAAALAVPALASAAGEVTPATGASLIAKLRTGVDWTAFGRAGEGDSSTLPSPSTASAPGWLEKGFSLSGADLYRFDCRSCHGPDGHGARSGIPPIQGELANGGAELQVRHRLVEGGRVMPPVAHLTGAETDLLLGYLRWMSAGAKGESPAARVEQPAARVGEHLVKANCQICHDAVSGPWRQPADQQSVIPLAQMTEQLSVGEFVRKVRTGSPVAGNPHGRMPRFDYLSPEELEAAYVYLTAYPPRAQEP
jgi:mono/diheme cytochrome c family protein